MMYESWGRVQSLGEELDSGEEVGDSPDRSGTPLRS